MARPLTFFTSLVANGSSLHHWRLKISLGIFLAITIVKVSSVLYFFTLSGDFFAVLLSPVLDGFDQLLSSALSTVEVERAVNKSLLYQEFFRERNYLWKNLENAENQTQGRWVRSKYAIHCAMRPPIRWFLYVSSWLTFPLSEDKRADGDVGEHDDDVDDDGDGNGVGRHEVLVADVFVDQTSPETSLHHARRDLGLETPGSEPATADAAGKTSCDRVRNLMFRPRTFKGL